MRPFRSGMIVRNASPTSRSEPVMPGPLGVRRVAEQQVDAAVAELGEPADVGLQPVDRRVVELPVAGVEDAAGRRLEHDGDAVRDRVRHAHELEPERAELRSARRPGSASRSSVDAREAVLVELRLDQPERQPRRDHLVAPRPRAAGTAARRRGPRAPCVSTTARTRPVAEVRRSRAGRGRRRGARRAGTRDPRRRRRLAAELEDGHVLADLAETAERDDPQARSSASVRAARRPTAAAAVEQAEPREAVARRARAPPRSPRRAAAGGRRRRGRAGSAPP